MPRVSVIIAAYDIQDYLGDCLESLLAQTMDDFEVIVVDDASPDGTGDVADRFAARDPRIRVIRHERNRGPGGARNTGLEAASGEFVSFVDGDDWVREDMLERAYCACRDANVPVCLMAFTYYWPREDRFDHEIGVYDVPRRFRAGPDMILRLPVTPWTKLYRRDVLDASGVRFAEHRIHEDSEFFFSFFAKVEPEVVSIPEQVYVYRGRLDSIMGEHERTRGQVPPMLAGVWTYYRDHGLVDRYGAVMCALLTEHLRATLPGLDADAQQPFYDGLRPIVQQLASDGASEHFGPALSDALDHGYVGYLQCRNAELRRVLSDPWHRFGTLGTRGKVRSAAKATLGAVGLDRAASRIRSLVRRA